MSLVKRMYRRWNPASPCGDGGTMDRASRIDQGKHVYRCRTCRTEYRVDSEDFPTVAWTNPSMGQKCVDLMCRADEMPDPLRGL